MNPKIIHLPADLDSPSQADLYYGQDVRETLRSLPNGSVHMICTSPPYWGLRDYGIKPVVWGGDPGCDHIWGDVSGYTGHRGNRGQVPQTKWQSNRTYPQQNDADSLPQATCSSCGAWRGHLGLEPSPGEYVQHMVEIFREVRRVLRPDGTLWLNLGDSYAQVRGHGHWTSTGAKGDEQGQRREGFWARKGAEDIGLKPKDLVGIPWRVAFALQSEGWYLRQSMPWIKGNPLPESVTDRPTSACEFIFLMLHPDSGGKCYYDVDAVKMPVATAGRGSGNITRKVASRGERNRVNTHLGNSVPWIDTGTGRNRRNSDWFFESIERIAQVRKGVLVDEEGVVSAMVVNPKPYPGAHFAVWPADLVEPMILAGTSDEGCCDSCGSPYRRIIETSGGRDWKNDKMVQKGIPGELSGDGSYKRDQSSSPLNVNQKRTMLGWAQSCKCQDSTPVPSTVMDLFSGSGTTGRVALQLHRNYIGCDLGGDYLDLAVSRIRGELPAAEGKIAEGSVLDQFLSLE